MAVAPPIPTASVSITVIAKPGRRPSERADCLRSCANPSITASLVRLAFRRRATRVVRASTRARSPNAARARVHASCSGIP